MSEVGICNTRSPAPCSLKTVWIDLFVSFFVALQWCREYAWDGLEDAAVDVTLTLADALSFEDEEINVLKPWSKEESLSTAQRCALLLRLGRAYRGARERSTELPEGLVRLPAAHAQKAGI